MKKDQCLLSLINATLSSKVLSTMFGLNIAKQACKAPQIYIVIILNTI
jgi:hypothetical protein